MMARVTPQAGMAKAMVLQPMRMVQTRVGRLMVLTNTMAQMDLFTTTTPKMAAAVGTMVRAIVAVIMPMVLALNNMPTARPTLGTPMALAPKRILMAQSIAGMLMAVVAGMILKVIVVPETLMALAVGLLQMAVRDITMLMVLAETPTRMVPASNGIIRVITLIMMPMAMR